MIKRGAKGAKRSATSAAAVAAAAAATKSCPDGKEVNPITGRCVNICKVGTIRNKATGKCDKIPNGNNARKGRPKKKTPPKNNTPPKKSLSPIGFSSPLLSPHSQHSQHSQHSPHLSRSASNASATSVSSPLSKSFELYYPDLDDPEFTIKIANNKEFLIHKIPEFPVINNVKEFDEVSNKFCGKFDKMLYQHFVSQYISYRTPYRSILLYHGVGVGKTCSAITISEALLSSQTTSEPMIWVIMPQSLKNSFKSQVFNIDDFDTFESLSNQCTDHNYIKLLNIYKSTFNNNNNNNNNNKGIKEYREKLKTELKAILKTRYDIFTYDRFAKYINDNYSNKIVENKVIIIDEAHNIRSTNKKIKDTYLALMKCLEKGVNNRLILLSATPMYNEPRDILELLKLLIINDKRFKIINDNKKVFNNKTFNIEDANVIDLLKSLSSTYISYLKGKNPFTFALKLNPSNSGIKVLESAPTKDLNNKLISKENLKWFQNIDEDIVISKLGEAQKKIIDKLEKLDISDDDIDIGDDDDDDDAKQNNNMKLLQPMNIVFDNDIGIKGFYNFFSKTKDTDPIELKYVDKYKNALMPDKDNEHLGKYSGKFLNVCDFIRNSKGIVVIYSRFLLSGIIPIAISLEHLGYTREGTNNILKNAEIVSDKPVYDGIATPKYCILTSDKKEYMGNTKIDDLIKIINSDDNYNGAKIKVILITPVASEGLSFYNTREIHLIEPWYHFNRSDQIIGRGIRNCRHNRLKIEDRNVSVFMHASVNDDNTRESIDINAFRISTRKYIESKKIDKIIMDNAIDCHLMKNINYFPKSLFKLDNVNIETSQGALIKYNFGDEEINEPKCPMSTDIKINSSGFRSEIYKHLLASIKTAIKNIINIGSDSSDSDNKYKYIDFETLKHNMGDDIDDDILMYAIKNIIYPNILINNKYITRYKNGLLINNIETEKAHKIIRYNNDILIKTIGRSSRSSRSSLSSNAASNASNASNASKKKKVKKAKLEENKKALLKVIGKLDIDEKDINKTTISLYLKINAAEFKTLISYILKSYPSQANDEFDRNIQFICECLYRQGILIKSEDIPSYIENTNEYIGYINMFNENSEDDNTYIQYNENDKKLIKKYKNYTEYLKHIDEIQKTRIRKNIKLFNTTTNAEQNVGPASKSIKEYFSNRINNNVYIPQDMTDEKTAWGIIVRSKNKYILKLFSTGDGKKTGRVCETFNEEEHNVFIEQLMPTNAAAKKVKMKNKKILCSYIANILLNKNKLVLFPMYKPKM
jgi:hypothetical protein